MQPLASSAEPIRLKLAKQMFRDGWLLTQEKVEFGEIRFGSLRLKASGKSADGDYELKKDKLHFTTLRDGKAIAEYEGKTSGKLKLASGEECSLETERVSTIPGSINCSILRGDGQKIVSTETTWNALGVPHCDLVIEPSAPTGDDLWGAIFTLLRVVVEHSLWNVSKEAAAKFYVGTQGLR